VLGKSGTEEYPEHLNAARLREQKMAYEAARHLASVVESAQDPIYSERMDGTIVAWNPAAEKLFGYAAAEIVGRNASALMPPERANEEAEVLERLNRGERVEYHQSERLTRDGRRIAVSLSISPVYGHDGGVMGVSTIARLL